MDLDAGSRLNYHIGMSTTLRDARQKAQLSQSALAEAAGTSQPQIKRLENGERKLTKEWAERLAPHLSMRAVDLLFSVEDGAIAAVEVKRVPGTRPEDAAHQLQHNLEKGHYRPPPQLLGERDFKVYASVEGGPGEMTVFSTEPYEIIPRPWIVERDPDAFGVYIAGESMEPVYEAGQIALVSPRAPLVKGKDFVLTAEPVGGDFRAVLKRYRGQNEEHWLARQFNPDRDLEYSRDMWRKAYRVLGRVDGT